MVTLHQEVNENIKPCKQTCDLHVCIQSYLQQKAKNEDILPLNIKFEHTYGCLKPTTTDCHWNPNV